MIKFLIIIISHSKFILTIIDIDFWLKSCENHVKNKKISACRKKIVRMKRYRTVNWDKRKFEESYYKHLNKVKQYFKDRPEDLLVLDIFYGDGYKKLCSFLGKQIIKKPFPHKNVGKYKKSLIS